VRLCTLRRSSATPHPFPLGSNPPVGDNPAEGCRQAGWGSMDLISEENGNEVLAGVERSEKISGQADARGLGLLVESQS
jgi:hypothetical protein